MQLSGNAKDLWRLTRASHLLRINHPIIQAPFGGSRSRRTKVIIHGASCIRLDNGKISQWADYYDGLTSRRTALAEHFTKWVAD